MNFLTKLQGDYIAFDLARFVDVQKAITFKYETLDGIDILQVTPKEFINKYDRYILHTIEELNEVYEELEAGQPVKAIEELVDVIMYIGSAEGILRFNMVEEPNENIQIPCRAAYPPSINSIAKTYLLEIMNRLCHIRMLFPQRKWHKPYTEFTPEEFISVIQKASKLNTEAISIAIQAMYCLRGDTDFLNEKISSKEVFIKHLAVPK